MDKNIQKKYESLPDDVRKAIDSTELPLKLQKISSDQGLHVDQAGILEEEVASVMLGIIHPDEFVDAIEERLGISTEKAIDITTSVNMEIIIPIRESLMTLHEKESSIETRAEEVLPSKEEVLHEIENPTQNEAPKKPSTELMVGRLTGIVQIPGGKSQIPVKKPTPPAQPIQPIQKTVSQSPNDQRPRSSDPYREPVN